MQRLQDLYEVIAPFNRQGVALTPGTRFIDDLELDSLSVMELVAAVEDRFDLTLPLNLLPAIHTIGDLADHVTRLSGGDDD